MERKNAGAGTAILVLILLGAIFYFLFHGNFSSIQNILNVGNISTVPSFLGGSSSSSSFSSSSTSFVNFTAYMEESISTSGSLSCFSSQSIPDILTQYLGNYGVIQQNGNTINETIYNDGAEIYYSQVILDNNGNVIGVEGEFYNSNGGVSSFYYNQNNISLFEDYLISEFYSIADELQASPTIFNTTIQN